MCALQGEESQKAAAKPQSLARLLSHTGLARKEGFCGGKEWTIPLQLKGMGAGGQGGCTAPCPMPTRPPGLLSSDTPAVPGESLQATFLISFKA